MNYSKIKLPKNCKFGVFFSIIEVKAKAVTELVRKEGFGWFYDLLLKEKVRIKYTHC